MMTLFEFNLQQLNIIESVRVKHNNLTHRILRLFNTSHTEPIMIISTDTVYAGVHTVNWFVLTKCKQF